MAAHQMVISALMGIFLYLFLSQAAKFGGAGYAHRELGRGKFFL